MDKSPEQPPVEQWDDLRQKILGLGQSSHRKSYFPLVQEQSRSLEQMGVLLDCISDAVFWLQMPEGRIVDANQAACGLLGLSRPQVVGSSFFHYLMQREVGRLLEWLHQQSSEGNQGVWTTDLIAAPEEKIPVEISAGQRVVGEVPHVILIARDISARIKADEEKKKLEALLLQSQKMESIGQLAGGIAHDFNNLLSAILGYSDMALDDLKPEDPLHEMIVEISKAGNQAKELTQQLLAFSRKQVLDVKVANLNEIIQDMEKMLRRLIGERISLEVNLAEELGCVRADCIQLQQVVMNLVINARDAMPEGGLLTITTCSFWVDQTFTRLHAGFEVGPYILLTISDTGSGIDPKTLPRIFDPFFSTKAVGRGTGLGLSTVHGIVSQHKGVISVYSEKGTGTTFKIYLPQCDAPQEEQEPTYEQIARPGNETILLVEDDDSVRHLAHLVLSRLGYHVLVASTPLEALEIARPEERCIDLLLSDVIMPGLNGQQLYAEISKTRPQLRVLFMSGYSDDVVVHQGILQPGIKLLTKPFTTRLLERKVREILDMPLEAWLSRGS